MSIATTSAIVCGAAGAATSDCHKQKHIETKYDGWILLGIIVVEVGGTLLCCYWPW